MSRKQLKELVRRALPSSPVSIHLAPSVRIVTFAHRCRCTCNHAQRGTIQLPPPPPGSSIIFIAMDGAVILVVWVYYIPAVSGANAVTSFYHRRQKFAPSLFHHDVLYVGEQAGARQLSAYNPGRSDHVLPVSTILLDHISGAGRTRPRFPARRCSSRVEAIRPQQLGFDSAIRI